MQASSRTLGEIADMLETDGYASAASALTAVSVEVLAFEALERAARAMIEGGISAGDMRVTFRACFAALDYARRPS